MGRHVRQGTAHGDSAAESVGEGGGRPAHVLQERYGQLEVGLEGLCHLAHQLADLEAVDDALFLVTIQHALQETRHVQVKMSMTNRR